MENDFYSGFEERPAVLLWSVFKLWQRRRRDALKELGVTQAEFITLGWLFWFKQKHMNVTQVMLAQQSKIDSMHMSRIVRSLEKKGILTRTQSADDSRANFLYITPKGEQIAPTAIAEVAKAHQKFFAPIEDKEKEFVEILKTLIQANDIAVGGGK